MATIRLNTTLEGRYRVGRELGQGGMATVYLAEDLRHERKVALKVLKPEVAAAVGADAVPGRDQRPPRTCSNRTSCHCTILERPYVFLFYVMPERGGGESAAAAGP